MDGYQTGVSREERDGMRLEIALYGHGLGGWRPSNATTDVPPMGERNFSSGPSDGAVHFRRRGLKIGFHWDFSKAECGPDVGRGDDSACGQQMPMGCPPLNERLPCQGAWRLWMSHKDALP